MWRGWLCLGAVSLRGARHTERPSPLCSRQQRITFPITFDTKQMTDANSEVLQGTLDLLVLKALSLAPMHGWGISQRILQLSQDALKIGQGSLYPSLYRLEKRGMIVGEWGTTDKNREAKYYRLTAAGKRELSAEVERWRFFTTAVNRVVAAT